MDDLVKRLRTACSPESPLGKLCAEAAAALSSAPVPPVSDGKVEPVAWQSRSRSRSAVGKPFGAWTEWAHGRILGYSKEIAPLFEFENRPLFASPPARHICEEAALSDAERFTMQDHQRLLRRSDVSGICETQDMCFEYSDRVRCGPCAIKQAARHGIETDDQHGVWYMADVVKFPTKDRYIFVCRCGCTTFQIGGEGEVECADCGNDVGATIDGDQPGWRKVFDPAPTGEEPAADTNKTVRYTANEELLRRRVSRRIEEWAKDGTLIFAVGYNVNSGTIHWTGVQTAAGRDWCLRRLDEMRDWLHSFEYDEEGDDDLPPEPEKPK